MDGLTPPAIICHIQDRDLWRFELPATADIIAGLKALKDSHKFEIFDTLVFNEDGSYSVEILKKITMIGSILNDRDRKECESFTKQRSKVAAVNFMGYKTAVYNTTTLISEMGSTILRSNQGFDISMSYFVTSKFDMVFSLRSYEKGENVDVGSIAKSLGGGGHKNAAGFKLPAKEGMEFLQNLPRVS